MYQYIIKWYTCTLLVWQTKTWQKNRRHRNLILRWRLLLRLVHIHWTIPHFHNLWRLIMFSLDRTSLSYYLRLLRFLGLSSCSLRSVPAFLHLTFSTPALLLSAVSFGLYLPFINFLFRISQDRLICSWDLTSKIFFHFVSHCEYLLRCSTCPWDCTSWSFVPSSVSIDLYDKFLIRMKSFLWEPVHWISCFCLSCFVVELIISANSNFVNMFFDIFYIIFELS